MAERTEGFLKEFVPALAADFLTKAGFGFLVRAAKPGEKTTYSIPDALIGLKEEQIKEVLEWLATLKGSERLKLESFSAKAQKDLFKRPTNIREQILKDAVPKTPLEKGKDAFDSLKQHFAAGEFHELEQTLDRLTQRLEARRQKRRRKHA